MAYIQVGSPQWLAGQRSEKVEIQTAHVHVTASAPSAPYVQPGTEKPVAAEIQTGLPFVTPTAPVGNHVQVGTAAPEKVEIQQARPHAAVTSPTQSNYQQPDTAPRKGAEIQNHRLKLNLNDAPTPPYVQPGTSAFRLMYDPGTVTNAPYSWPCPYCGSPSRHIGSSMFPFVCDGSLAPAGYAAGVSHQFALLLNGYGTPDGRGAVISGAAESGANQVAPGPGGLNAL
jgi:hypothetical protein